MGVSTRDKMANGKKIKEKRETTACI